MSLHLNLLYFALHLLILSYQWSTCSATPSFRIIAPQTICKHEGNGSLTSDPQAIVVGFQPRDGIKLSYKLRIFFKINGNRTRSQRNTLLVWKAVRSLENRINVKERLKISKQNMISINKTEVEPGVLYMFHIIGITDAGEFSKEKVFTIKYTDGVLERNETVTGLNFLLIGAESTVASIPYIIIARVFFCVPRYDYYLQWKMLGLDEEFQDILHTTGTVLRVPPNSLKAGREYQIQANLIHDNDSTVLAQDFITVQVMKRGFQAYIIPTSVKVGLNKPAIFEVVVQDFDNNLDPIEIVWVCATNDGDKCAPDERTNSTRFEFFFSIPGSYEITATVRLGEITRSTKADVFVDPTVYLSYEFSNIPNLIPAAGQSLFFSVLILDLIPNCKAGWSAAQEEGFMYIRPDEIGDGFGVTEVKDLEREYLSEIADFGNSTVNKEIVLNIPPASGKWGGLLGDVNYKFRLDTVCPGPYISNDPESINRKVVSSFEFVVHTNSPPMGGDIHIKPANGTALRTVFELSTEAAKDILLDTPLSYEFLLHVNGYNLSLGKFYEFKSIDTQLPYSVIPVQIMSRVCDIRGACSLNIGPTVRVEPSVYTQNEIQSLEGRILEDFQRTDLREGQNLIFFAALTYKSSPSNEDTFKDFKEFATNLLEKEIDKQYESPTEKYYISKEDVVTFIRLTRMNLEILDVKDPAILVKLLDLLDLTAEETEESSSVTSETFRRRKRDTDTDAMLSMLEGRSIVDEDYVKTKLNIIANILDSYKDQNMREEKLKVAQRIPALAANMCTSDLITKENIFTSVAAIDIEKMTGNLLVEKNFTIFGYFTPALGNFRITLSSLKSRVKYYCAAFMQFPEDYFEGESRLTYRLQLIDIDSGSALKEIDNEGNGFVVQFVMPKSDATHDICLMRQGDEWLPNLCVTKLVTRTHIMCDCRNFGYFKTGNRKMASVTSAITPTTFSSVSKRPLTAILTAPSKNIVSTANKTQSTDVGTTTKLVAKTTQATTMITSNPLSSAKTKDTSQKETQTSTAGSTLNYTLPLLALLSILIVIGTTIFYRRRKRHLLSNSLQGLDIMATTPRESRPGVKYAKFYDEHLMTGSFNNAA